MPVITGTGGTGGWCRTMTGVVAQAVAEPVAAVARGALVVGAGEVAVVGGVPLAVTGAGVVVVGVGDESPAQPPATVSTARTMSPLIPFMAVASVGVAG